MREARERGVRRTSDAQVHCCESVGPAQFLERPVADNLSLIQQIDAINDVSKHVGTLFH